MLCRKRRLIQPVVAALEERRIPVEAVGTSGLLDRPEVVDVVAWLEVLADPSASVALLRLLGGPRYRIGFRDLAALSRHSRTMGRYDDPINDWAGQAEVDALAAAAGTPPDDPMDDPMDDIAPVGTALAPPPVVESVLADALLGLGRASGPVRVEGLSDEAHDRLAAFDRERRHLADQARRLPVLGLVEAILARTGLWQAAGPLGRQNLLRFLDLAERFRPVEGDPGLAAFVEYLHLLDESEEDLAEAHLGDTDAVRVMTIHQAKGLEFDTVYVPGLAGARGSSRIFPDGRPGENALGNSSALPWWLREDDEGFPPVATARMADIEEVIRRRKLDEEWRLLYVACTRARKRLVCSAAHWYPGAAEPQGPSAFYDFVAGQTDIVSEWFRHEPASVDPEVAAKERFRAAATRRYPDPVASGRGPAPPRLGAGRRSRRQPRARARPPAGADDAVGHRAGHLRPLSEAVLLERRAAPAPALLGRRPPRHRGPSLDRTARRPPAATARARRIGRRLGRGRRRRSAPRRRRGQPAEGVVPGQSVGRSRPCPGGGAVRPRPGIPSGPGSGRCRLPTATASSSWSISRPAVPPPVATPGHRCSSTSTVWPPSTPGGPSPTACARPTAGCAPTARP